MVLPRQRAPCRLAHVACRCGQSLLDATVAGDCGQYTTAPHLRRVDDELAVRRDARRFVERTLGQDLHLSRREILQRDVEASAVATNEHEALAVRQMSRRNVVAPVVRHAFDRTRGERQPIDLRAAASIRREKYRTAVRSKVRLGVDAAGARETLHVAAIGVDEIELRAAVLRQRDCKPPAVRRPRRRAVTAAEIGDLLASARSKRLDVYHRLLVFQRYVGDARAIGRPDGGEQGLVRLHDRLRIEAVGFGNQELVAEPLLGDVSDARAEHADVAGEFFVDHIGDAMRGRAKLRRRDGIGKSGELDLLRRIEQGEPHLDPAIRLRDHGSHDDGVRATRGPIAKPHVFWSRRTRRDARRIDEPEQPAPREVGANDAGYARGIRLLAGEWHDRDRDHRRAASDDIDGELCPRNEGDQAESEQPEARRKDHEFPGAADEGPPAATAGDGEKSAWTRIITNEKRKPGYCARTVLSSPSDSRKRSAARRASSRVGYGPSTTRKSPSD